MQRKCTRLRPCVVAFVGINLYQTFFGLTQSGGPGKKAERIANAYVFVVPNPSGLNATFPRLGRRRLEGVTMVDVAQTRKGLNLSQPQVAKLSSVSLPTVRN